MARAFAPGFQRALIDAQVEAAVARDPRRFATLIEAEGFRPVSAPIVEPLTLGYEGITLAPKPLYKRPVVWAGVALAGGLLAWLWGRKR